MNHVVCNTAGEPLTILLVEDNPDHKDLILRNLEDHQIANRIYSVCDGEAALDYLYNTGDFSDPEAYPKPHLILLDLRLPKIDGIDVLRRIKNDKELKVIPVVILTTSEAEVDILAAYDNHVNSYLVKPVDFNSFKRLMDDLGFYWLAWNRNLGVKGPK